MYGIYVRRNKANLLLFDKTVGFRQSIVTRGKFAGLSKRLVLHRLLQKVSGPEGI